MHDVRAGHRKLHPWSSGIVVFEQDLVEGDRFTHCVDGALPFGFRGPARVEMARPAALQPVPGKSGAGDRVKEGAAFRANDRADMADKTLFFAPGDPGTVLASRTLE